jgi:hypothetical protein
MRTGEDKQVGDARLEPAVPVADTIVAAGAASDMRPGSASDAETYRSLGQAHAAQLAEIERWLSEYRG